MALVDSITKLKKALNGTIQTVPALIETLKNALTGVEEAASSATTFSTDEREVGTWINGKTIFERTYYNANKWTLTASDTTTITDIDISEIENMIDLKCTDDYAYRGDISNGRADNGKLRLTNIRAVNVNVQNITMRYTKAAPTRDIVSLPEEETDNQEQK